MAGILCNHDIGLYRIEYEMKWNRLQKRVLLSLFIIIILTIIVYHICSQYQYVISTVEYKLKPPKSKLDSFLVPQETVEEYLRQKDEFEKIQNPPPPPPPVGYTVRHLQSDEYFYKTDQSKWLDDTQTTFSPLNTSSTLTSHSHELNPVKKIEDHENDKWERNGDEPLIEGFAQLGDFFQFLDFLFEAVVAMICISLTLPIHMFEYAIGIVHFTIAFFWFMINVIGNIFVTFFDFTRMMNDISKCGMTFNKNLPFCFVWYMIDLLGYLAIMVFVWLPTAIVRIVTFGKVDLNNMFISIVGVKGSGYRDTNGNRIERDGILALISKKFTKIIGFDPMHFPPNVMQKCYSCNIIEDFFQVIYDVTIGFMNTVQQPMEFAGQGIPWLWRAFYLDAFLGKGSFCSV